MKGLRPIELAEDEAGVVEFADFGHELGAGLWRRLREFLIGQFGAETADKVAPSWEIDSIAEVARRGEPAPGTAFAEPTSPTEASAVTEAEKAALEAENQRLKAQLEQREQAERAAAQHASHAANVAFAEQLVAKGMKPVHSAAVIAALDFAEAGDAPLEFGEGDARQPLGAGLKALFGELAGAVSFAEQATQSRAGKVQDTPTNPLLADAEARAAR